MSHDDLLDLKAERDDWQTVSRSSKPKFEQEKKERSGSGIVPVLISLILAVLLAGMGYWVAEQINQIYDQFDRTNHQLDLLSQRVEVLEGKLDISNDSMANSAAAFKATLKEHDSEIRKLWGVSYDRNRKTLQTHTKKIDQLNASIAGLKSSSDKLAQQVKSVSADYKNVEALKLAETIPSLKKDLKTANENLNALTGKLDPLLPKLSGYQETIAENTQQIKELNDELLRSITDIQIQLNDDSLDKEVDELASLINSIDKNRSRVNAELVKLSNKVNELQKANLGAK